MIDVYDSIATAHRQALREGRVRVDPWLSAPGRDARIGLSLVVPVSGICRNYERIVAEFKAMEPDQYYYPREDLHVTIFDFIVASEDNVSDPRLEATIARFCGRLAARADLPDSIVFGGLAFSDEAGILCGQCPAIPALRDAVRRALPEIGLENRERYRSLTAHATFMRFMRALDDAAPFAELADALRHEPVGEAPIASLDLVRHDWYNRASKRELVARFPTGGG